MHAGGDAAGLSFTELLTMDTDMPTPAQPAGLSAATHHPFDPYAFPVPGSAVTQSRPFRDRAGAGLLHSQPPSILPAPMPHQLSVPGHASASSWLKLVPAPSARHSNPVLEPRQVQNCPMSPSMLQID